MSFISSKSLLAVLCFSLLSLHLVKAQAIQGEAVRSQLESITPIQIDLDEVTLIEAVEMLKSIVSAKGISNFNVIYNLSSQPGLAERTANLYLENINADFAFEQILQTFDVLAIYDSYAIKLIPAQGNNAGFISQKWQVPPVFFKDLAEKTAGDPSAFNTVSVQKPIDILKQLGVNLPEGSSVIYLASSNFLEVRAPVQSIDIIDKLVIEAKQKEASQVSLRIKYVTIDQDELDELGFDWATGGFTNITGGAVISDTINDNLLDVTSNLTNAPTKALTVGNRTITELGEFNNNLDIMLGDITRIEEGAVTPDRTPGVLSYIDNFESSKQAAVMLRALSQAKSFDVMESPHLVVKSGQQGTFFKGSEIKYPATYENAIVETVSEDYDIIGIQGQPPSIFSVLPSHPVDFETQKLGLELMIQPTLSGDNQLINLNINPQIYEFKGFINYGSTLMNVAYTSEFYSDGDGDNIILIGVNQFGQKVVIENVLGGLVNSIVMSDAFFVDGLIDSFDGFNNNITVTSVLSTAIPTPALTPGFLFNQIGYTAAGAVVNPLTNFPTQGGIPTPITINVTNTSGNIDSYTLTAAITFQDPVPNTLLFWAGTSPSPLIFNVAAVWDLDPTDTYNYTGDPGYVGIPTTTFTSAFIGLTFPLNYPGIPMSYGVDSNTRDSIVFVDANTAFIFDATPNYITQPIFNKAELNTQATIQSGETVLLGGLLQQNKITLDDSLPLLGDIPLAGRLFENQGENNDSKAILIFVEAVAQDPLGNPVSN